MTSSKPDSILLIDDEADVLAAHRQTLELAGFNVRAFDSAEAGLLAFSDTFDGVIVCDLRMPGMDGLELFRRVKEIDPEVPIILVSGHADIATAVNAVRQGAYDFLSKPFLPEQLVLTAQRALERRALTLEVRHLRDLRQDGVEGGPLYGSSGAITALRRTIAQVAEIDVDVLIEGETGTGKSLVAAMLHAQSNRSRRQMVTIDCGALPDALLDEELFGVAQGAYPAAYKTRVGRLELAHKSTLFLDAIDAAPMKVQQKLHRALEVREVTPLGAHQSRPFDARIVAASSSQLTERVQEGSFFPTLLFRLNSLTLKIPPLRQRREDIPLLYSLFLDQAAKRYSRKPPALTPEVYRHLRSHDWPGNVRELQSFAEQNVLGLWDGKLPASRAEQPSTTDRLKVRVAEFEKAFIEQTLQETGGDIQKTIASLGLPRKTFYDKVKRLKISLADFRVRN